MKMFVFVLFFLQAVAAPRGSIEGVVMKAGTASQQSLPNARLELRDGAGTPVVVRSDAGGRFLFSELAPGQYRLFLTQDGFIRQEYRQRFANMPGTPIMVAPGQQAKNIVFRLDAAPTIAGSVLDQDGNPLGDILVAAARRTYEVRGKPTLTLVASAITDDRGAYRIFWVDPGEYYVSAGYAPLRRSGDAEEPASRATYAPVYFPGITDPEGVKPIRVDIGREINGVDFRLRRQGLAAIFGQTTNAITRKPVAATINLMPVENANVARYQGQSSAASGAFAIPEGVAPGSYVATARSASGENLAGFTRIKVPSVRGFFLDVRLALNPGIRVNGRMISISESLPDIRRSQVILTAVEPGFPSPAAVSPLADGQFSMPDVFPGEYFLTVANLPDDIYLKAARHGDTDVLETFVTVSAEAAAFQIMLGSDGGRISVTVLDRENRPVSGAQAVLVPDAARRHRPDQYRLGISGEDARLTMRGIPPGDYKLFVWEAGEPNAYLNADYLRAYEDLGLPLRIALGENGSVQARPIPAER